MTNYNIVSTRKFREEEDDRILAEEEAKYKPKTEDDDLDEEIPQTPEEQTWKKRYSDLRSFEAKKEREALAERERLALKLEEAEAALRAATRADMSLPQSADPEVVKNWVRDYPDVAAVFRTLMQYELEESHGRDTKELKKKVTSLEQDRFEAAKRAAYAQVLSVYPNFGEVIATDEFKEWVAYHEDRAYSGNKMSQAIYDALMVNETDGDAAIEAFSQFVAQKAPKKKVDPRAEAAATVRKSAPSAPAHDDGRKNMIKESDIEKMSDRDYERLDVDGAMREGRIIYDISGAAR